MSTPDSEDGEKYTWRMWLSNRLHLLATRIHNDFHTWEITTPGGDLVTFSCYWQHTGSWLGTDRCSCECEDLQ